MEFQENVPQSEAFVAYIFEWAAKCVTKSYNVEKIPLKQKVFSKLGNKRGISKIVSK